MKFCSNCGKQLPDNAKFCTGCGASLGEPAAPVAPAPVHTPAPVPAPAPVPVPAPAPAPKKKGGKGLIIAIIAILLVAALGVGIWALIENDVFGSSQGKEKDDENEGSDGKDDGDDQNNDEDDDPVVELPDDPAEAIVGQWRYEMIFNSKTIDEDVDGFDAECMLPLVFTFTADGEVSVAFYEEDPNWDAYYNDFVDFFEEYTYCAAEEAGMTREEADEEIEEEYGMSFREYCEEYVAYGLYDLIPEGEVEYTIEDGILIIDHVETPFSFKGGKLYIEEPVADFLETSDMPMVLKKVG